MLEPQPERHRLCNHHLKQQQPERQHGRLLLFLRYPEPGHTKTRLIPALGATGAAQLQRQMAEYLLERLQHPKWQIQVHFTGAHLAKMHDWLGTRLSYRTQVQGNLGDRIWAGFQQAFSEEPPKGTPKGTPKEAPKEAPKGRIIAIGADCPELSARHIQQAFQALITKDVVLGPAADGGYYLIGLRRPAASKASLKALFQGIAWSTPQVFQQTRIKAEQLGLSLTQLETLSDIDRPADLAIWDQIQNDRPSIYSFRHNP